MGYEDLWKILADIIAELRKKGETIPPKIMEDLHSAKTMIQILKVDPTHVENRTRAEEYLENVESDLFCLAEEKLGVEFAEVWTEKIKQARRKVCEEEGAEEKASSVSKFVPGVPRDKHWVRVQISEDTPRRFIEKQAKESKLLHKPQKNGYVLVYGDEENVKSFVRRMAKTLREKRKKVVARHT